MSLIDPILRVHDRNQFTDALDDVQTSQEENPGELQRTLTRIHLLLFSLDPDEFVAFFPFPKDRVVDHLIRIEELVAASRPDTKLFVRP